MIELRRLRAFVTVVEEGNITRAAERLFIQQPPLTRLLQGLEDELGVTLLQRLPRGVRVTEAGGVLFEEARALLARAERLREAVQRAARGEQGHSPSVSPVPPRCIRSCPTCCAATATSCRVSPPSWKKPAAAN